MIREKKRLLLEFVHNYFLPHASILSDNVYQFLTSDILLTARYLLMCFQSSTMKVNVPRNCAGYDSGFKCDHGLIKLTNRICSRRLQNPKLLFLLIDHQLLLFLTISFVFS